MSEAVALSDTTTALHTDGGATYIMEAQQEYETEQNVQVTPAKSIWLNTTAAKRLQTFLNDKYGLPKDALLADVLAHKDAEIALMREFLCAHSYGSSDTSLMERFYEWRGEEAAKAISTLRTIPGKEEQEK